VAIVGNLPGSWNGWESYQSSKVQVGQDAVVPAGYTQLLTLHGYVAREGSGGPITLCCWRANTIIASLATTTGTAGAGGPGNQSWCGGNLAAAVAITPGETLRVGWQRGPSAFYDWSWATGGTHYEQDATGNWSPVSASGTIGAYGDLGTGVGGYPSILTPAGWVNTLYILGQPGRLILNGTTASRSH
jgi:hypothetical protein